ncbi:MAG: efflux RND transporter periplasmic adaptor subunit [Polyangiaceae bacterium]
MRIIPRPTSAKSFFTWTGLPDGWGISILPRVRYLYAALGLLVVIGILVAIKFSQISGLIAMGKAAQKNGPPPESVSTDIAQNQDWEGTLVAVGSVASVKGVQVSNDAPGVVTRINFESGQMVKEGQPLVELDTNVERTQLASAKARLDLAQINVGRSRALVASKAIAQAQLDNDEAQLKAASTDIDQINAQIARKTLRAPFAGKLGIRNVNLGQYLNPGTPITVLEGVDAVYVDFSLPQQRLANVKVGMPVRIELEAKDNEDDAGAPAVPPMQGNITAIDPTVDAATRMMKLRAQIPNGGEGLRPGMFVNVTILLPDHGMEVTVPQTAVIHAPYGDSVFIVEDKKPGSPGADTSPTGATIKIARQQFIRPGEARGDFIAVMDGVQAGQEVVTAGAFKLKNGSPIVIDNKVKAAASLTPHPENH